MSLTRIQIITLALDQAGLDSSFNTKAYTWFNVITEKLSFDTRYKFYNLNYPDVAFIPGQNTYALPTDYRRSDTCYLINADGSRGNEIFIVEPYRFDSVTYNLNGLPNVAMIDLEAGNLVFNNTPSSSVNAKFRLRYFKKAAVYALNSSDDNVIPDFESQEVLIEELIGMAFFHQDDERFAAQEAKILKVKQNHQRNMYESQSTGQIDLAHENFRHRRRR